MLNATSSQGSAAGASVSDSQDGPTTALFGRDPVRASLSARQAEERGLLMSGTSGPIGTTSSASASLQSSLESRLRARTASVGSTLYALTWKPRATPSGRQICALRASARRTSDSGSGSSESGWPTPAANTYGEDLEREMARRERLKEKHGNGNGAGMTIALAAQMAGWPTPMAGTPAQKGYNASGSTDYSRQTEVLAWGRIHKPEASRLLAGWPTPAASDGERSGSGITEGMNGGSLTQMGKMAGWPTPRSSDGEKGSRTLDGCEAEMERKGRLDDLPSMATWAASGWPTPTTRDHKDTGDLEGSMYRQDGQLRDDTVPRVAWMAGPARLTATGEMLTGSSAGMESGGQLNPGHSRWLMGYPPEWDDCGVTAMPSSRKSRQPSSGA